MSRKALREDSVQLGKVSLMQDGALGGKRSYLSKIQSLTLSKAD